MYKYTWDEETGGLLLLPELSKFSKEPRPVYYKELDILGFDKYWNYPKDDHAPLLWAEANNYIYKGRTIAKTQTDRTDVREVAQNIQQLADDVKDTVKETMQDCLLHHGWVYLIWKPGL